MKMGKLIVIEGTDGSGKSTQFSLLTRRLEEEKVTFRRLVFPRYSEPSSALIKMYLGGAFGSDPKAVNGYAASAFYAVDRYASYKQDWGQWYENGGVVISDRYTTSNAVHQASKLPSEEREAFLQWLYDFEYRMLELPKPDLTIDCTEKLMRHREQETNTKADIHEQDMAYLATCRQAGREAAAISGWTVIQCVQDGVMRSVEDIHEEIYAQIMKVLEEQ